MKSVVIKPTGYLDTRSEPEEVPAGGWRWALNMQMTQKARPCRSPGWVKLLDKEEGYNNQDIHSQLLEITGHSSRKPITFLFDAESTLKTTMLLAGTEDALYQLNVGTGNYRVLSTSIGGFLQAAQNRDTIILTNDHDEPRYWVFDTPEGDSSLKKIPDLEELGITKVGVVTTFRGFTFYMNVVENGRTFSNRVMWSDVENPLSIIPAEESTAGSLELDIGESILNAKPMANVLMVYTTRGIWQVSLSSADRVFEASKRYDPEKSSEAVLAYRNTLVSTGDTHVYMGQSGIFEYSLFESKPKLIEWVHAASSLIYESIDKSNCYGAVAGFNSERHEIWLSWTAADEDVPSRTLCFNTQYRFSSVVDHGFTAFCQFQPRVQGVLRDWILENCICTEAELQEFFGEFENEGGYCEPPEAVVCDDQPDSFFTSVSIELEDGIVTEDFNQTSGSDNSLCSRLDSDSLADLCVEESQNDQCNASRLFVMASAQDYCLKQTSDSYYREVCTGFDACGTYALVGYKSILRSGPLSFKNVEDEKRMEMFEVAASVIPQTIPSQLVLRVGASHEALDPNLGCGIVWQEQTPKDLKCLGGATEAQHLENNTRPDGGLKWPVHWQGMNLYFELTVENTKSTPVDVGGGICFSHFQMQISPKAMRY